MNDSIVQILVGSLWAVLAVALTIAIIVSLFRLAMLTWGIQENKVAPEPPIPSPSVVDSVPASAGVIMIKTTFHVYEEAKQMANALLDQGIIASGQIVKIESRYWWDGQKQDKTEWELTCLTRFELYSAVETFIRDQHSFLVPEVVAVPIIAASDQWASWVIEVTTVP